MPGGICKTFRKRLSSLRVLFHQHTVFESVSTLIDWGESFQQIVFADSFDYSRTENFKSFLPEGSEQREEERTLP